MKMSSTAKTRLELVVSSNENQTVSNEPITVGIPWPKGSLTQPDSLRLFDTVGNQLPLQTHTLDTWPDGSIRWTLLDWQSDHQATAKYQLAIDPDCLSLHHPKPITLEENANTITAETGDFSIQFSDHLDLNTLAIAKYQGEEYPVVLTLTGPNNENISLKITHVHLLEKGPLRSCIKLEGTADFASQSLHFFAEAHCFAGSKTVRWQITLRNPQAADHPGGMWDLGAKSSIFVKDASLRIDHPGSGIATYSYSSEIDSELLQSTVPLSIYQDSSGGEHWKSTIHLNREHRVPLQFQGYQIRIGEQISSGLRATPIVKVSKGNVHLGITMPYFWQNFPKAAEVTPTGVRLALFPKEHGDLHEIQGGEQKTHTLLLTLGKEQEVEHALQWGRQPSIARAEPIWYSSSNAIPYLTPKAQDPHLDYLALVDAAIEGNDTFEKKRESIDEYGWRHCGDIYGDHEAVFHKGEQPLVSHYNNQYDPVLGFGLQYLRSGDDRWIKAMNELANHVIDIDIYHTTQDKAAYNHGLFWHTFHYVDADTGHHRTYPKNGRVPPLGGPVPGGGPANEQNYAGGLALHYFMTGSHISKENAIGLAQWVINMDDGKKSIFRWLAGGATGLASQSRSEDYHGPGRGAANSVLVLLEGFRLTGEKRFLNKAEELIRRVIHPNDRVSTKIALRSDPKTVDAENRWFYTMFLQALGAYLDIKIDLNELDRCYAYARESLLHYSRWMAENECPYLEKPEILEYPTETWAAQDMRKSEVFTFAMMHADGKERERFAERANYFFHSSVDSLSKFSTKTLCRPVVLMLRYGMMHAWLQDHKDAIRPKAEYSGDFGSPIIFEPQKARAKRNLKKVAAAGLVIGIGLLTAIAIALLR